MPLHADHEVSGRVELDSFNDAIDWRDSSHKQIVAGDPDGLMMAGVDLWQGSFGGRDDPAKPGPGSDLRRMSMGNGAARLMIHRSLQVLDQGAVAPDVERLRAVADGENGLLEIECILQQELVDGRAAGVGLATLWDRIFAKSLRVHIEAASRQQDALNPAKQPGNAVRPLVQRDNDGGYACGVKGGKIGGQGALVVFGVAAGWFGDGDMEGHGGTSVKTRPDTAIEEFSLR